MNKIEKFSVGKEYAETFRNAITLTERRLLISNTSISIDKEGNIEVEETKASFLLTLGMEYQKLLNKKG